MPTGNPLEQLRRRMQSQATPAAFAALAEEHRRAGRLAEAIAVCRDGLSRYPAYVSARVTLGRALLDSGDAVAAVAELEQAVGQAPDNLAAVRALDAARAECPDLPTAPPPPPLADLTLQASIPAPIDIDTYGVEYPSEADQASLAVGIGAAPDVPFEALTGGADAPQEFGLRADWTLPDDASSAAVTSTESVWGEPGLDRSDAPVTQALDPHADAPTMYFTAPHMQGEEPAGIWPVPLASPDPAVPASSPAAVAEHVADVPPVFSWALDAPGHGGDDGDVSLPPAAVSASIWDAPTIEAPLVDLSPAAAAEAAGTEGRQWTGLFDEPVGDGAEPSSFAGWDAPGPAAHEPPAWASDEAPATSDSGIWAEPAAPAEAAPPEEALPAVSAWQEPYVFAEAVATADADGGAPSWAASEVDQPEAPSDEGGHLGDGATDAAAVAIVAGVNSDLTPFVIAPALSLSEVTGDGPNEQPSESTWAGSVASALDEVFRQAGQPVIAGLGHEPSAAPGDPHRDAMASVAVEAAIEDAARRDETAPPALASLQQMLDNVRARRAALFTDVRH